MNKNIGQKPQPQTSILNLLINPLLTPHKQLKNTIRHLSLSPSLQSSPPLHLPIISQTIKMI